MQGLYGALKVIHVLSVVAWIGGTAALGVVTAMLIQSRDRGALAALLPRARRYGATIGGSSSVLVLLTGMGMLRVGGLHFRSGWVLWGMVGIGLHFAFAMSVMRKRGTEFALALSTSPADDTRMAEAGRALRNANLVYLVIMASVIVAMVYKPTL